METKTQCTVHTLKPNAVPFGQCDFVSHVYDVGTSFACVQMCICANRRTHNLIIHFMEARKCSLWMKLNALHTPNMIVCRYCMCSNRNCELLNSIQIAQFPMRLIKSIKSNLQWTSPLSPLASHSVRAYYHAPLSNHNGWSADRNGDATKLRKLFKLISHRSINSECLNLICTHRMFCASKEVLCIVSRIPAADREPFLFVFLKKNRILRNICSAKIVSLRTKTMQTNATRFSTLVTCARLPYTLHRHRSSK